MKIVSILKHTPAQRMGLLPGDEIISINGHAVRDPIDFQFCLVDEELDFVVRRGPKTMQISTLVVDGEWFGVEFAEMKYRCCGNKCIFCFVDQNPNGLRDTLYFKDEDYRLSFLYGNYVTLTNISQNDLQRIISQRLSPLYISVHATDWQVRKKLLGLKQDDRLLEKISFLAQHGIEMHAQIVLCPGVNDGMQLQKTVDDLASFFPNLQTVAIVPIGITTHREKLVKLQGVDKDKAIEILQWSKITEEHFREKLGSYFIFLADEFYLLAQLDLPKRARYENFSQIENGVGMTRALLDTFNRQKRWLPLKKETKISIVTGIMAAPVLKKNIISVFKKIDGFYVDLIPIKNEFFGGTVSVSGLLVGQDIFHQLKNRDLGGLVALPPNCVNSDNLFLDDWTPFQLQTKLGVKVFKPQANFLEIFKQI